MDMVSSETIMRKLELLPETAKREVADFIDFLVYKGKPKKKATKKKKLSQNWANALSHYRDQYTSLELQEKALEWRGD